ncbi:olfactory receptor 13C9-like [Hyla sarda]|uniref:olfactory receptor 13C9-like n=1 Tax=Hyla sarda TaxID=327740 RepID=UPI0024C278B4|nr:olfactory receptor 13C9-like [Hyla sarda]
MDYGNQTLLKELILIGLTQNPKTRIFLSVLFLFLYMVIVLGNSFLIFTVILSPQLHTPMYYFLCNLSFIDLCFTSCTIPKQLFNMFSNTRTISVTGCLAQMSLGISIVVAEVILLAVMAYDRYIAICFPLYYTTIMRLRICGYITVIIWLGSLYFSLSPTLIKPLVFCKGNTLDHLACEILVVIELACGDLSATKLILFIQSVFILASPLVFIVVTYICIIASLLKIHSAQGKSKAFSTCASHLTVVVIFYGTTLTAYIGQAKFTSSLKYIALNYGIVTPVLNPLIYSLRNNDVKEAFKKILIKYSDHLRKTNIGLRN